MSSPVISAPSPADFAALSGALQLLTTDIQRTRWRRDPAAWLAERLGEHAWSKQIEIMESVRDHKLTAVQSSHGVGKSFIGSRLIGWALDTHDPGEMFVVSTAPTWSQVRAILWRYIGQMHRKAGLPGYVTQNAEWKIDSELVGLGRKPADHDESGMQGLHARTGVLAVIDEACGVRSQIWTAIDSLATTAESRIVALGNPDTTASRFHEVCSGREPGWNRVHISAFSTPNFTTEGERTPPEVRRQLVSREWVADKALRWGEKSPLYKIKVLGEFADDEAGLIPHSWIVAAQNRWRDWFEQWDGDPGAPWLHGTIEPPGARVFGVDVAAEGEDETVIATRQGDVVMGVERWAKTDTVTVADLVTERLKHPGSQAVVDSIGVGQGVLDLLRRRHADVQPFIASRSTKLTDATGTQGFPNVRSAAWWRLRELLDPANAPTLCLPPDDDLAAELTSPKWSAGAGGKLIVESKDATRRRIGRSTDSADAVLHALWFDAPSKGYERERDDQVRRPAVRHWGEFGAAPTEPRPRPRVRR